MAYSEEVPLSCKKSVHLEASQRAVLAGWALAALMVAPLAADQDLETVLRRHEKAMGGAKRLAAVRGLRVRGLYRQKGATLGQYFELEKQGPHRMRFRLVSGKDRRRYVYETLAVGRHGHERLLVGSADPSQMEPTQVARTLRVGDLVGGPLLRAAAEGEVELLGADDREPGPLVLRTTFANGDSGFFYRDRKTYRLLRVRETWWINDHPVEILRTYDGYRSVGGVRLPVLLTESNTEGSRSFRFDEYELNPEMEAITYPGPGQ